MRNTIFQIAIEHVNLLGGVTRRDFLVHSTGILEVRDWAFQWGRDRKVYILDVVVTPRPDLIDDEPTPDHMCRNLECNRCAG